MQSEKKADQPVYSTEVKEVRPDMWTATIKVEAPNTHEQSEMTISVGRISYLLSVFSDDAKKAA